MHQVFYSARPLAFLLVLCMALPQFAEAKFNPARSLRTSTYKIAPGRGEIQIHFILPPKHHFALEAPSHATFKIKYPELLSVEPAGAKMDLARLPYTVRYDSQPGYTVLVADLKVFFCDDGSKICLVDSLRIKIPIEISEGAPSILKLNVPLRTKKLP